MNPKTNLAGAKQAQDTVAILIPTKKEPSVHLFHLEASSCSPVSLRARLTT